MTFNAWAEAAQLWPLGDVRERQGAMLSNHGKQVVAGAMYSKGKNFALAGVLLSKADGYEYVVLHCLCQAIELVLKALLLKKDYGTYVAKLRRPIGHDLCKAADTVIAAYARKPLTKDARAELQKLSALYAGHRLRYGTVLDILVDPTTIPTRRTMRRFVAVLKLSEPLFQS